MPESAWLIAQQQEDVEELLEQGKQDYMEGRFEEAMDKLSLAIDLLSDKGKLVDAYLHLALCHFALGERGKAKENLAGLLRLDPAQKLDPLYYPPDFIVLLDEAKGIVLARIRLDSDPLSAQVYFDGKLVGITPLQLNEIAAGEHRIRVVKQDYMLWEESIIIKEGEEKTVSIRLREKEKKPSVAVTPAEKKPEVKKKSNTWLWILIGGAAAAAVAILAGRGGGGGGGGPTSPDTGSINVTSNPKGAKIYLDGRDTNQKTNSTLTNVSAGSHNVKLVLGGYKIWTRTVSVSKNQTASLNANLQKKNLTVRIRVNFEMSNLRSRWIIYIDGKKVFDEWIAAYTNYPERKVITRDINIQRQVGQFVLKLYGVDYDIIYSGSASIYSTDFELSIFKPESDKDLIDISPDSFSLGVVPWRGSNWPEQKEQKITISPKNGLKVQFQKLDPSEPIIIKQVIK